MDGRDSTTSSHASYTSASSGFSSMLSTLGNGLKGLSFNRPAERSIGEAATVSMYDPDKEPIQCYLRIRPSAYSKQQHPSMDILDDTLLSVTPGQDETASHIGRLPSSKANPLPELFKFTKIFEESTSQQELFAETALPSIKDVLTGKSALLFAYGITSSGKTHTVQGPTDDPGLLPRSIDVIFNSIAGKHSNSLIRPCGIIGVEPIPLHEQKLHSTAALGLDKPVQSSTSEDTCFPLDDTYKYSVWISYAEIYNDQIYDLFDQESTALSSSYPSSSSLHSTLRPGSAAPRLPATFTRRPLNLKIDSTFKDCDKKSKSRYIHGLREVRVFSAEEAKSAIQCGQHSRRVFATLLNKTSSRSHGILTIRVVRVLSIAGSSDVSAASCSRFSIIDLAGSERSSNTGTVGDRLREAGNINKSLFDLGQCIDTLRRNQEALAKGRKPQLVPYRASKLTEIMRSFLQGHGKAAMVVNLNPWDTPVEENLHVLRFSAVAKQISTAKATPVMHHIMAPQDPFDQSLTLSSCDASFEDFEQQSDDEDDDEMQDYADKLYTMFEDKCNQVTDLRMQLSSADLDIRHEMIDNYEKRIREMENAHQKQIDEAIQRTEAKMNAKIDLLTQYYEGQLTKNTVPEISESFMGTSFDIEISPKSVKDRTLVSYTPGRNHAQISQLATPKPKTQGRSQTKAPVQQSDDDDDIVFLRPIANQPKTAAKSKTATKAKPSAPSRSKVTTPVDLDDHDGSFVLGTVKPKKKTIQMKVTNENDLAAFEEGNSFIQPAKMSKSRSTASLKTSTSRSSLRSKA